MKYSFPWGNDVLSILFWGINLPPPGKTFVKDNQRSFLRNLSLNPEMVLQHVLKHRCFFIASVTSTHCFHFSDLLLKIRWIYQCTYSTVCKHALKCAVQIHIHLYFQLCICLSVWVHAYPFLCVCFCIIYHVIEVSSVHLPILPCVSTWLHPKIMHFHYFWK